MKFQDFIVPCGHSCLFMTMNLLCPGLGIACTSMYAQDGCDPKIVILGMAVFMMALCAMIASEAFMALGFATLLIHGSLPFFTMSMACMATRCLCDLYGCFHMYLCAKKYTDMIKESGWSELM